jgi:hypothetical protein
VDLNTFRLLVSPAGGEALQAAANLAPQETDFLRHFTALSKRFPAQLARAALEIAILRDEAQGKFPFAGHLYFTRPALEQATGYPVACYRAGRFAGCELVADLACSVGGDTLALATQAPVVGVDLDALRLAMASANLDALGLGDRASFLQADLLAPLPWSLPPRSGLFFDPARRTDMRRIFSVRDYRPPLSIIESWLPRYPALGVKISPGVNLDELWAFDAEIEFISWKGELKEAVLWFGPLKSATRRATVLPGPHTMTDIDLSFPPGGELPGAQTLPLDEPRAYLYEPDPSILRSGLVQALGAQLDAAQLDPDIAYLTSNQLTPTPFARIWAVEDWFPFSVKRLRSALRERNVGRVTVKKRGSPLQPEELIRLLHLKSENDPSQAERVIFLTHLRGRPIVVICFPERLRAVPQNPTANRQNLL